MTIHKHQLPHKHLEENDKWIAFLEIKRIGRVDVEVDILLKDKDSGEVSTTDVKYMRAGDSITIEPWSPADEKPINKYPPFMPYYYWIVHKKTKQIHISRFVFDTELFAYVVTIPALPKKKLLATQDFYNTFLIVNRPATLEDYENTVKELGSWLK